MDTTSATPEVDWSAAPALPGGSTLHRDRTELAAAARDMGRAAYAIPGAILRPRTPEDIATMVRWCAERGIPARARGCGHTMGGQGLPPAGGLQIDMTALDRVHAVEPDVIDVSAGTTLRTVVVAAWSKGAMLGGPTDFLDLTVGGVLSAGGWSSRPASGVLADTCRALQVVTADGDLVWCSRTDRPELYRAMLGGFGTAGILTRAQLDLCSAPRRVRTESRSFADIRDALHALRAVIDRGVHEATLRVWAPDIVTYHLVTSVYYDDDAPDLLKGLDLPRLDADATTDLSYLDHSMQVTHWYTAALARGWADVEKRWSDIKLPDCHVEEYLLETLPEITTADISPTSWCLISAHRADCFSRHTSFRLPRHDGPLYWLVDVLSDATGVPTSELPAWRERMVARDTRWRQRAERLGGVVYPIGSDWPREHFTPAAEVFRW